MMRRITILLISLISTIFLFTNMINAIDSETIAGDTFELIFPITNNNDYQATYEFYLIINPDSEGFHITMELPDGNTFNPGQKGNVIINITTPLQTEGGNYTFILHYNYSSQEREGEKTKDGSGSSSTYCWNPPDSPYMPLEDEYTPEIPDDFVNIIRIPGPGKTSSGNSILFLLLYFLIILIIILFVSIYKKKKSE